MAQPLQASKSYDEGEALLLEDPEANGAAEQPPQKRTWLRLLAVSGGLLAVGVVAGAAAGSAPTLMGNRVAQQSYVELADEDDLALSASDAAQGTGLAKAWRMDSTAPFLLKPSIQIFQEEEGDYSKHAFNTGSTMEYSATSSKELGAQISGAYGVNPAVQAMTGPAEASMSLGTTWKTEHYFFMREQKMRKYQISSEVTLPHTRLNNRWKEFLLHHSVEDIHHRLGDFYATQLTYGGAIKTTMSTAMFDSDTAMDMKGEITNQAGSIKIGASVTAKIGSHEVETKTDTHGGENSIWLRLKDDSSNFNEVKEDWANSINDENQIEVGFHLVPLWDLLDHEEMNKGKAAQLKKYMTDRWDEAAAKVPQLPPASRATIRPVFEYWHEGNKASSYHFKPKWGGECERAIEFYAFDRKMPEVEPVYNFWHPHNTEYTFHMGDPWEHEEQREKQFWAFKSRVPGTECVYDFWDDANKDHTFHFGGPKHDEKKGNCMFWAFRNEAGYKTWLASRHEDAPVPAWEPSA